MLKKFFMSKSLRLVIAAVMIFVSTFSSMIGIFEPQIAEAAPAPDLFQEWLDTPDPDNWVNKYPDYWYINRDDISGSSGFLVDDSQNNGVEPGKSMKLYGSAQATQWLVLDRPWYNATGTTNCTITVNYKMSADYNGTAKIEYRVVNKNSMPIPNYDAFIIQNTLQKQTEWTQVTFNLTAPMYASKLIFKLKTENATAGAVWFDDISVKVGTEQKEVVMNSSFDGYRDFISDEDFFGNILDLNRSELSQVKLKFGQGDIDGAKQELLNYFVNRTDPIHPFENRTFGQAPEVRPSPDSNYDTYFADMAMQHYFSDTKGEYNLSPDIDWDEYTPDRITLSLVKKNYFTANPVSSNAALILGFNDDDTSTIARDSSGKSNEANLYGEGIVSGSAIYGQTFYGNILKTNETSWASIPYNSSLSIDDEITVEARVASASIENKLGYIINKENDYAMWIDADGKLNAKVNVGGGWITAVSSNAVFSGQNGWKIVSFTYSKYTKKLSIYINSELEGSTNLSGLSDYSLSTSTSPILVGGQMDSQSTISNSFNGYIDFIDIADIDNGGPGVYSGNYTMGKLADAYWYTGDAAYAKEIVSSMLDWYKDNQYREEEWKDHPEYETYKGISGVDYLLWDAHSGFPRLLSWSWLLYRIKDCDEALTPSRFTAILKSLYLQAKNIRDRHPMEGNGAASTLGYLYEFSKLFPIFKDATSHDGYEGWTEHSIRSLETSIFNIVYPEGVEYENVPGYHYATVLFYDEVLRFAKKNNLSDFSVEFKDLIEKMYEHIMYYIKPDKTTARNGDSQNFNFVPILKAAASLYERDDFLYAATGGGAGTPPESESKGYNFSGFYFMRSDWTENANYLNFDAGSLGFMHSHEDKLSIEMQAYGTDFIVDPYIKNFESDKYSKYFTSTAAHNTIMVDGMGQARTNYEARTVRLPLSDTEWVSGKEFDFASGKYETGYGPNRDKSAKHTRSIFFAKPEYWLLHDVVNGLGTHSIRSSFQFTDMPYTLDPQTKTFKTINTSKANMKLIPVDTNGLNAEVVRGQEDGIAPDAEYVSDENTVLLYHFNEGTGNAVKDSSSYNNDSNIVVDPVPTYSYWVNDGVYGTNALTLNDPTVKSGHVMIPDKENPEIDLKDNLTVEGWVRWNGQNKLGYVVYKNYAYALSVSPDGRPAAVVYLKTGDPTTPYKVVSTIAPKPVDLNKWTHLRMTYSSFDKQLKLYMNGLLVNTIAAPAGLGSYVINTDHAFDLYVGARYDPTAIYKFGGAIDEVRISNVVRNFPTLGGFYNPRVFNYMVPGPQLIYTKESIDLPTTMDYILYPYPAGEPEPSVVADRLNLLLDMGEIITPAPVNYGSAIKLSISDTAAGESYIDYILTSEKDAINDKIFSNYTTDAQNAYIRRNATDTSTKSVSIMNGKKLVDTASGKSLIEVLSGNSAERLSVSFNGNTMEIDTSLGLPAKDGVKIYAPGNITAVYINGIQMINTDSYRWDRADDYIYIGEIKLEVDSATRFLMRFDESSGSYAKEELSGNAERGIVTGTNKFWKSSKFGNAISTVSASGEHQYLRLSNGPYAAVKSNLTAEGWFMDTGTTGQAYLIDKKNSFRLYRDSLGHPVASVFVNMKWHNVVAQNVTMQEGVWYHIAMTYYAGTRTLAIYVNGNYEGDYCIPLDATADSYYIRIDSAPITIGGDYYTNNNKFIGNIDEVRLSRTVRDSFIFNRPYDTDSSTMLLLHLDESTGGAKDAAGNPLLGVFQTGALPKTFLDRSASTSVFGNAFFTNGDDYITVTDTEQSGSLITTGSSITMEAWINPTEAKEAYVFAKDSSYGMALKAEGSGVDAVIKPQGTIWTGGEVTTVYAIEAIPLNQWSHVAMTYDGSLAKIFINGVLKGQASTTGNIDINNNPLVIGRLSQTDVTTNFKGYIDDLRISDSVRTVYPYSKVANTAPVRKIGVDATGAATVTVNNPYTIDLSTIFEDTDRDALTYKVSVNGTEPVETVANYVYTPTATGTITMVFKANDGKTDSLDNYTVTLKANAPLAPVITTTTLQDGMVGTAYNQTLAATGDTPITWTVIRGRLPKGLAFTGNSISGTPTNPGTYKFTMMVTNTVGSDTQALKIVIGSDSGHENDDNNDNDDNDDNED